MRIRWTDNAVRDLIRICDRSEAGFGSSRARKTALEIHEAVDALRSFPNLGRPGRKAGTFELVITGLPFLAVYRVHEGVVEIVRLLHGAQKWP
jgi:toxin ParE1/3/4